MVDRSGPRGTGVLVFAAVAAGLVAATLVVLGIWLRHGVAGDGPRFAAAGWWVGMASQAVGYLAFGKAGFKVALAVILGASGVVAWIRESRRRAVKAGPGEAEPTDAVPGEDGGGKIQNSP